uniref:Rho-GAP domain-containing protein n=1 Tax=Callorhinchus milii TaxID=7868 RepID=A0A4W3GTR4_CALMI
MLSITRSLSHTLTFSRSLSLAHTHSHSLSLSHSQFLCSVPQVLRSCSEFIEKYGIVDGIYRLSGISSNIQKLR